MAKKSRDNERIGKNKKP